MCKIIGTENFQYSIMGGFLGLLFVATPLFYSLIILLSVSFFLWRINGDCYTNTGKNPSIFLASIMKNRKRNSSGNGYIIDCVIIMQVLEKINKSLKLFHQK